jgi:uncharacterized integral membrane protein
MAGEEDNMKDPQDERGKEPAPERRLDREQRGAALKIGIGLFLLIVFVLFIIQNSGRVPVDFVFFTKRIRLIWVFLACALLGASVTWLVGRPRRRAMRRLVEELERQRREND